MNRTIEQLNKLRGRGLQELKGRGLQELAKLADRLFIVRAGEMSDEALYGEFAPSARNSTGEGTAELLRDRLRSRSNLFLPSLEQHRPIADLMNRRFPAASEAILARADRAIAGEFDLLGYRGLHFGAPIDWHLDPVNNLRAPRVHWSRLDSVRPLGSGDPKIIWELNRHPHFITFGQAYWLTGDHRYAEAFVNQAGDWMDANPSGVGINWSQSLEVAFRAIAWIWALHLCAGSRVVTPDFVARLAKSLIEHGRHIEKYLSTFYSPNTHLTGEAIGLFYLGVALPELKRAANWRKAGLKILLDQLPIHVRPDGVFFEQSSYYHRYTADFYLHLFTIIRSRAISLAREDEQLLWQRLESLFDHLMWIQRPDGSSTLFGDDDGGRLIEFAPRPGNDFRDTLAMGATIFKRGDWKNAAGDAPPEMLWLLGPEAIECYDRLQAETPRETSRAFARSGYFVMRDGWERDSSYVWIDCGRHGSEIGSGHAHADALAIEFAARGVVWLVDPATFVYGAAPEIRDAFRSTAAHNTVTVDGQSQSITGTPFAWQTEARCSLAEFDQHGDVMVFEGSHDGYHRLTDPVTHTRAVTFAGNGAAPVMFVRDRFSAAASHQYAIRYHFAPGCEAQAEAGRVMAHTADGEELAISVFGGDVRARIEAGWVSTRYGERLPAPVAVFEAEADGPVEFSTVIVAAPQNRFVKGEENSEWSM